MRYILRLAFLLLFAFPISLAAGEVEWSADTLAAWVGKYPTTTVNGKKISILEEEQIKHHLKRILLEKEQKLLRAYHVETPIKQIDQFIVINKCRPHICPSELAMVVVDLQAPRVWAGFFSRATGRTSTRWYSNGDDYSVLPSAIKQEFLSKHGD